MSDKEYEVYEKLSELDTETVLNLLIGWHGVQLIRGEDFKEYLENEGVK